MASDPASRQFDPARLIDEHQAGVWRYLRALGCDPAQADDLTQETFLHVLQRPFQQINAAATSAYLRRTAYNLFISLQRKAGRTVALENLDQLDALWTAWAGRDGGDELLDVLRGCLDELTERTRKALEWRYRDERTRADIAAALEMTEDGAKNLLQRAKQKLRDCIEGKLK